MGYSNKQIFVLGDPILDVWIEGQFDEFGTWKETSNISRAGGAANVYRNILSMCSNQPIRCKKLWNVRAEPLVRVTDIEANQPFPPTRKFWLYTGNQTRMYPLAGNMKPWPSYYNKQKNPYEDVLILSDYNRGVLNKRTSRVMPNTKLTVVDSKYRSLHPSWLHYSAKKIWHATGDEYNYEWARYMDFDYVVHTDGPNPVKLYSHPKKLGYPVKEFAVPDTQVVNTIGAGDTFTAALAAHFANQPTETIDISPNKVFDAVQFAIDMCQQVIQEPYTAVPNKINLNGQ